MALTSSGAIKFSEIQSEFGYATMGSYRLSESYGGFDFALDNDTCGPSANASIPTSGAIKFSDFYNARRNIVIDYHTGGDEFRKNARSKFDASTDGSGIDIVGGLIGKPSSTTGKKVVIVVNKTIGSAAGGAGFGNLACALHTGDWDNDTTLQVKVGSSGKIYGGGGDGGTGGAAGNNNGGSGQVGTSAIGINYTNTAVTITNNGKIQSGYGGGGGGAGRGRNVSTGKKSSRWQTSTGGGGGGGAGYPVGAGGGAPSGASGGSNGSDGSGATKESSGAGGAGGNEAGSGGAGGVVDSSSTAGTNGSNSGGASGGSAGSNGYAIITASGSGPTVSGTSVVGRVVTSTTPLAGGSA